MNRCRDLQIERPVLTRGESRSSNGHIITIIEERQVDGILRPGVYRCAGGQDGDVGVTQREGAVLVDDYRQPSELRSCRNLVVEQIGLSDGTRPDGDIHVVG